MYDLTFKLIKARICYSYDVYQMDNSYDQKNIHLRMLIERYQREDFNNVSTLNADIDVFLTKLQNEVDYIVGWQLNVEDYLKQIAEEGEDHENIY